MRSPPGGTVGLLMGNASIPCASRFSETDAAREALPVMRGTIADLEGFGVPVICSMPFLKISEIFFRLTRSPSIDASFSSIISDQAALTGAIAVEKIRLRAVFVM